MQVAFSQSERHGPPLPIRALERSSRLSGQMQILITQLLNFAEYIFPPLGIVLQANKRQADEILPAETPEHSLGHK